MAEGRVVILGARGMLGTDLSLLCRRRGIDVTELDLPEFDITDEGQLRNAVAGARAVVNCAAYTNVDGAESERELAHRVNGEAVGRLGCLAREVDAWVLHISTDFVFDGTSDRPYTEVDQPNPVNEYGRSKLAGEKLLVESCCRHCILRVEWTYGSAGSNFVKKLIARAETQGIVNVVDDQIGSPTATTEVAEAICELLPKQPEGLFHFASTGYVSRYDMARFIVDELGLNVDVRPCKTSDYVSPAARPLNSRFDCSKIRSVLPRPITKWQKMLKNFLLAE